MDINDLTIGQAKQLAAMFGASGEAPRSAPHAERPVLVWTDKRGVIFGYTEDVSARPIILKRARMALYWSADVGGVFGLADIGPTKDCKISASLPIASFEGVTGVSDVTEAAEAAWNEAKVQGR